MPSSKKKVDLRWAVRIMLISFFLAGILSSLSTELLEKTGGLVPFFILLFFVSLGIAFDMVGIASTSVTEKEFHSMSARRVKGAKQAVFLVRNAAKVSNFCNDVVGDISGIISGATGAVIVSNIIVHAKWQAFALSFLQAGVISALTIGGKAMGKEAAISYSHSIIFMVGKAMAFFSPPPKGKDRT